jgi:hypothetical protein
VNTLLQADDFAFEIAGDNTSNLYYESLWSQTKELTEEMFSRASHSLAELLYTAWIRAGRPYIKPISLPEDKFSKQKEVSISPNPVKNEAIISFNKLCSEEFSLKLYDISGRSAFISKISFHSFPDNKFHLNTSNLAEGSYYLVLQDKETRIAEQILISK